MVRNWPVNIKEANKKATEDLYWKVLDPVNHLFYAHTLCFQRIADGEVVVVS